MKISIVTASYNQGEFIEEAIKSVLDQNYPKFEHIIMDNCSTDNTVAILKRYPHLKWFSLPDKGQSDALNKGFKMAEGDIIGWLNADDFYEEGCFTTISEDFLSKPKADIIYGDYRIINKSGRVISLRKELDFDPFMLKYLHFLYIPTTTSFFKRRIFEEGNFLDISYNYAMDYDFFMRLVNKKYIFSHTPNILASFRVHSGAKSKTATKKQLYEQKCVLFKQDIFLSAVPFVFRNPMRLFLIFVARLKRIYLKIFTGCYNIYL